MRKDVKFGLTVGGILAATLIVYAVLLLHSGNAARNGSQDNQVATDTTPPPEQPLAAPALAAPIVPQLMPAAPAPDNRVTVTHTPDDAGNSAAPTVTPPATEPSAGGDWNTALNSSGPLPAPTAPALIDPQPLPLPTVVTPEVRQPIMGDIVPATQPSGNVSVNLPPLSPPSADVLPPVVTGQRTHTVVSGDSPWTIAQAAYGNGSFYTRIIAANPGINPNRLKIGTVLVIPDLTDSDRHPMVAVNGADPSPRQPLDVASEYRVVSGDTLERISNKLYGSPKMVEKLYQANKDLIGPDENKLKLGWVLKLPQPPSTTAAVPNTPVAAPAAMPAASTTPPNTDIPAN